MPFSLFVAFVIVIAIVFCYLEVKAFYIDNPLLLDVIDK